MKSVACLILLFASTALAQHPAHTTSIPALAPIERDLLVAINAERARYHLPELTVDVQLQSWARSHSAWMVSHGMVHSGYPCAENIAMGYPTVAAAVSGWMHSSGHRANILGSYRRTGVSVYFRQPNGQYYWSQEFSR